MPPFPFVGFFVFFAFFAVKILGAFFPFELNVSRPPHRINLKEIKENPGKSRTQVKINRNAENTKIRP